MKVSAPVLLPLLRSQAQGEILARVFLMPGEHSVADLARSTGVPEHTVLREVDRLVATGFVTEQRHGRMRIIAPNQKNPATQPLTALLAVTCGPAHILKTQLADVEDVAFAAIYGSWAARATGEIGHPPLDIDLLVVGPVSRTEIFDIAENASATLRRPVNARVIDLDTWHDSDDPFIATIRARPLIELVNNLNTTEKD
ncbi:MAG: winged helix-turn-helix domain-containing protein [Propionibacteriaceae bacterium]|nr:winged helix-turn-helix domain-containing protein [Propionibacteriaceae bacterium]